MTLTSGGILIIDKEEGLTSSAVVSRVRVLPVSYTHLDVYKRQNDMREVPAISRIGIRSVR